MRIPAGGDARYAPVLPSPFGILSVSTDPPDSRCELRRLSSTSPEQFAMMRSTLPELSAEPVKVVFRTPFTKEILVGTYSLSLARHGYTTKVVSPVHINRRSVVHFRDLRLEWQEPIK